MVMTLILARQGHEARTKDHRRTEMWLYLPEDQRPPQADAQWASATVMRETYLMFARWTALIAIAWASSRWRCPSPAIDADVRATRPN